MAKWVIFDKLKVKFQKTMVEISFNSCLKKTITTSIIYKLHCLTAINQRVGAPQKMILIPSNWDELADLEQVFPALYVIMSNWSVFYSFHFKDNLESLIL